jgi:hypothetical protein
MAKMDGPVAQAFKVAGTTRAVVQFEYLFKIVIPNAF